VKQKPKGVAAAEDAQEEVVVVVVMVEEEEGGGGVECWGLWRGKGRKIIRSDSASSLLSAI
jgi:hypothetical protein